MLNDLIVAARRLVKSPGFTITALLTYALCLGANVALFAVVNAVLIRTLPYPNPGGLVSVFNRYPKAGVDRIGASVPHYLERRKDVAAFVDAAAFRPSGVTFGDAGSPSRIESLQVTPSFFTVLGVQAALGRTFAEDEGLSGKSDVLVISNGFWRQNCSSDPNIVGKAIRVDGRPQTIVGVMPPNFSFGTSKAELWTPLVFGDFEHTQAARHTNSIEMIARLRPGATIAEAQSQVDALNISSEREDPLAKTMQEAGFCSSVIDLHDDLVNRARSMLLFLQAGVLFLLLIGAVNLANLYLVRAHAKSKEFALRQIMGASGKAIVRLLISESLLLSVTGGILGLALGASGLLGLEHLGADKLPHLTPFALDGRVCLSALVASLLTGLLIAGPTLWFSTKGSFIPALSVESRGATTAHAAHRLRHALIVAQFALAFSLLTGALLLGISFSRILSVDPGFHPENILTGSVVLPLDRYKTEKERYAFTDRLGQQLRTLPGMTAVGFTTSLPFRGSFHDTFVFTVEGLPPTPGRSLVSHQACGVAGNLFAALGIPLREGRFLTDEDSSRSLHVCVVDDDFVKHYWPGKSALGHVIHLGPTMTPETAFTIVGVVGATKRADLADQQALGMVYYPYMLWSWNDVAAVLRTGQSPGSAETEFRATVLRIDPDLPVQDLKTMAARIDDSLDGRRSPLLVASIFACVALLLAAIGIYGVLAYSVSQRRREIGIRMAIGAQPRQILSQFLSIGAKLVIIGSILGCIGGWFTGRAMAGMLYGVGSANLEVYVAIATLLALVAMAACSIPAVRAARVTPMEALRSE
jgi:predicted permease